MRLKTLKRLLYTAATLSIMWGCNREYFDFDKFESDSITPTYAIPIVEVDLKLEDVLKRYKNDVTRIYAPEYSSGTDSVFYLQISYSDTIGSYDFAAITGQSLTQPLPIAGLPFPFSVGKDSIELNIFGQLGGDSALFRLTNPSVGFIIVNNMNNDYEFSFDTLYTRNISNDVIYPFKVKDESSPFYIAQQDISEIVLNNDNTESYNGKPNPMTNVIEPTPKFVYYEPVLSPINSDSIYPGGEIVVVSNVQLPLEGYGIFNYTDTLPMQDMGVDTSSTSFVEEVTLRIISTNGLPLNVMLTAQVYDSTTNEILYTLPLLDEDGNAKPNSLFLTSPEIDETDNNRPTEPYSETTDITISNADFRKVVKGNSVIVNAQMFTSGFDNTSSDHTGSQVVKMYTDYTLGLGIGLKSKLNINPTELPSIEPDTTN